MEKSRLIGIIEGGQNSEATLRLKALIEKHLGDETVSVEILGKDWPELAQTDNVLVLEGDVKLKALEEAEELIENGASVLAFSDIKQAFWRDELQTEVSKPIAPVEKALFQYCRKKNLNRVGLVSEPDARNISLLKSLEEDYPIDWVSPDKQEAEKVQQFLALAKKEERDESEQAQQLALLKAICESILQRGAQAVLLNLPETEEFVEALLLNKLPIIDLADVYASYIAENEFVDPQKSFKIGLVGGLGPAATVDLYDKIVKASPAKTDQKHYKVIVEQNPQIPDRTAYLLNGGTDPTLALYAACRKLEKDGADIILIPCNTAHAFFESIAPHLKAKMINMQQTTLEEIIEKLGKDKPVGLMATDGTVKTGIYKNKADQMGITLVTPEPKYQALVMEAIYGPKGAKAGFTNGVCREQLLEAGRHLVRDKGAASLILGCTELPLILDECELMDIGEGLKATIVDPTSAVARRAVKAAQEALNNDRKL